MTEARYAQAKEWLWQQVVNQDRVMAYIDVRDFLDGWEVRNGVDK